MDMLKVISLYGIVKDVKLSDPDPLLKSLLNIIGFRDDDSSQMIKMARSLASSPDIPILDFIQEKGVGATVSSLLKRSDSEDVRGLGTYLQLANMSVTADEEYYLEALEPLGVDSETAILLRDVVIKNAKPADTISAFVRSPAAGKMLYALSKGMSHLPSTAGLIQCPHCEGIIKP